METKKELRKRIKEELSALMKPDYEHYSYLIAQNLFEDQDWKEARTIGVTISNVPEVDTYQIIRRAWEEGKKVAVPKCLPKERKLDFRSLDAFNQLESVFYGLWEPIVEQTKEVSQNEIDLLIVPGLAFSRTGYRLGFGGGYYDRFLQVFTGKTLSLAFQLQILDSVPVEEHDQPVDKIITDRETIVTDA